MDLTTLGLAKKYADEKIREATLGKTTETDPTVSEWAKQKNKPTYTPEEIGAQPKGDYVLKSELPAGGGASEPMKLIYDNTVEQVSNITDTVEGLKDYNHLYYEILIINTDATSRQYSFGLVI